MTAAEKNERLMDEYIETIKILRKILERETFFDVQRHLYDMMKLRRLINNNEEKLAQKAKWFAEHYKIDYWQQVQQELEKLDK